MVYTGGLSKTFSCHALMRCIILLAMDDKVLKMMVFACGGFGVPCDFDM